MLRRVAEHYAGIKQKTEHKYRVLSEVQRLGYSVGFDVLYYAKSKRKSDIIEEIGEAEGKYIRNHLPPLNLQVPKEDNWR